MTVTPNNTDQILPSTADTVIVAQVGQTVTILKATVNNTDTVSHTVTLNRVPNGGSVSTSNQLCTVSVAAGSTVVLPITGQTLVNQQALYGAASAASVVNLNIGYVTTP